MEKALIIIGLVAFGIFSIFKFRRDVKRDVENYERVQIHNRVMERVEQAEQRKRQKEREEERLKQEKLQKEIEQQRKEWEQKRQQQLKEKEAEKAIHSFAEREMANWLNLNHPSDRFNFLCKTKIDLDEALETMPKVGILYTTDKGSFAQDIISGVKYVEFFSINSNDFFTAYSHLNNAQNKYKLGRVAAVYK